MKTLFDNREKMSSLVGRSYSNLSKVVPMQFFSLKIPGGANRKLYSKISIVYYRFYKILAGSPKMTASTAKVILSSREIEFQQIFKSTISFVDNSLMKFTTFDPRIEVYSVLELKLLVTGVRMIPTLIPRKNELRFISEVDREFYYQHVSNYVDELSKDLNLLKEYFQQQEGDEFFDCLNTNEELNQLLNQIIPFAKEEKMYGIPYNKNEISKQIDRIHYSGLPMLVKDILNRETNFSNVQITDQSGDSGIDVDAIKNEQRFIVQCKHHKSRTSVVEVRNFSLLCNQLNAGGMFVATGGFSNRVNPSLKGDHQIMSDVKLVDKSELITQVFNHRIGMKTDGTLDKRYWHCLRFPYKSAL